MTVKEKLAEIIQNSVGGCARHWAEVVADGLIANGVTIVVKKEKKPTDLTAKCGSCVYAKPVRFGRATCYVCCTHPNRHWNRRGSQFRQRTTRACKSYKPTKGE